MNQIEALLVAPWRVPFNITQWDWSQLWQPTEFFWVMGVTPLSNLQVVTTGVLAYFTIIYILRTFMQNRLAFKMRTITAIHNLILCYWSAIMFAWAAWDLYHRGRSLGWLETLCASDKRGNIRGTFFYITYWYYISKYYELFDTVILVLKKKRLMFLHIFHHAIVIPMSWLWLESHTIYSHHPLILNTLVHIFMYHYYYRTSLGYTVWYKRYITSMQITQFCLNFITASVYLWMRITTGCDEESDVAFWFGMGCNSVFLVLFMQFYVNEYKGGKAGKVNVEGKKVDGAEGLVKKGKEY